MVGTMLQMEKLKKIRLEKIEILVIKQAIWTSIWPSLDPESGSMDRNTGNQDPIRIRNNG
jgi:hypothetical protein